MKKMRQEGFGLIELMVMTSIVLVLVVVMLRFSQMIAKQDLIYQESNILTQGRKALDSYFKKYGYTIVTTGAAAGFPNALAPSREALIANGFLPSTYPTNSKFNGQLLFVVRVGLRKELTGIVCDTGQVQEGAKPSFVLASAIAAATPGGVYTSPETPGILVGTGFKDITSPINNVATVCAVAAAPSPL